MSGLRATAPTAAPPAPALKPETALAAAERKWRTLHDQTSVATTTLHQRIAEAKQIAQDLDAMRVSQRNAPSPDAGAALQAECDRLTSRQSSAAGLVIAAEQGVTALRKEELEANRDLGILRARALEVRTQLLPKARQGLAIAEAEEREADRTLTIRHERTESWRRSLAQLERELAGLSPCEP